MLPGFRQKKIITRTVGQKLKAKRLKQKITLEEAEKITQVRAKFLEALEKSDFFSLPSDIYTVGFLVRYLKLLGLPEEKIISQFKSEKTFFLQARAGEPVEKVSGGQKIKYWPLVTPKKLFFGAVIIFILFIAGYISYELKAAMRPPKLVLTKPENSETIAGDENFEILGESEAGVVLTINAENAALDERGNFQQTIHLQPGLNVFEIIATNRLKRQNTKVIKVLLKK